MTVFKLTLTTLLVSTVVTGSAGAAAPAEPQWSWPLSPPSLPSCGRSIPPRKNRGSAGIGGVDLGPTHDGAPVTAPSDGVVTFSGVVVDRPVLAIEQGSGLKSSFEPVTSELKTGDAVRKGQVIGTLEPGHCSSATCLHWGGCGAARTTSIRWASYRTCGHPYCCRSTEPPGNVQVPAAFPPYLPARSANVLDDGRNACDGTSGHQGVDLVCALVGVDGSASEKILAMP